MGTRCFGHRVRGRPAFTRYYGSREVLSFIDGELVHPGPWSDDALAVVGMGSSMDSAKSHRFAKCACLVRHGPRPIRD